MSEKKLSPESVQRVADALLGLEAQREIKAMTEKEQAIIRAEKVIYAEVSRWVGFEVATGDPIPILRNGERVGQEPVTVLGGNPAKRVAEASRVEGKQELERKVALYQSVFEGCKATLGSLLQANMLDRVSLDTASRVLQEQPRDGESPSLAARVIREIGVIEASTIVLFDLLEAAGLEIERAEKKLDALKSGPGSPRNEAAYAVAKELALLYAKVTGKRPTYAAGRDGLSGEYTPSLRRVFDALGWQKTGLRGPAETARDAITDGDMEYAVNRLLSLFPAWGAK